ncbi:phosphopantetheine binding protein [Anaerobacterium chartisolvens]|uniref:Phosphopantetheine binding protein n=2 Tax=Anaerobacterium chartisolvens TaxID=1297424 RepID=A0A369B7N0_9FIRM|nr:phosphopantetheine binding protein [Anaerobacterium chartisolvens]
MEGVLEGIAVIGVSGRFPGAKNTAEFWDRLKSGQECITYFSKEEARACGIDEESINDPNYVFAGGILEDIELFDADFFSLNPREAENLDPQQRLFLECCYETLEDAGYSCNDYNYPIGVYAGSNMSYYFLYHLFNKLGVKDDLAIAVGNDKDYVATRASYEFNLKGPSVNIQTACSTSMTAIAMAYEGLLNYHCDMALAGGAGIKLPQKSGYMFQTGFIGSPDGHTRPFDADAYGTVFTSAVGVILLKRVEDAIRDGDHIYGVIKGMSVNNDGSTKVGFTAPSREGEAEVIAAAQGLAGVNAEDISYIEAHGTGTSLGDPIEVSALTMVFERQTDKKGFCAIGSVKSNIGHAISGAGVSGMIKTLLALKHKQIPPSINFRNPNPKIDFENSPFYVNTELIDWQTNGKPRIAGVSSFGFGGTNVHAVVEEAPPSQQHPSTRRYHMITLSAKSLNALDCMCVNLARHFEENPGINLADAAYTLHVGRKEFEYRRAIVCDSVSGAIGMLRAGRGEGIFSGQAKNMSCSDEGACSVMGKDLGQREVLESLAVLWMEGAPIDWLSFHEDEKRLKLPLPTYPFQRKRYWAEQYNMSELTRKSNFPSHAGDDLSNWFYSPLWKRAQRLPFDGERLDKEGIWLIFEDEMGLAAQIKSRLQEEGIETVTVSTANGYCRTGSSEYTINPESKEDHLRLIREVFHDKKPGPILHLWSVTGDKPFNSRRELFGRCERSGFGSLLFLAQALGECVIDDNIRLAVVSTGIHAISEERDVQPEKAVVIGPCKVIPMEYTNIFCQSIDVDLPDSNAPRDRLVAMILAELTAGKPETAVALRGCHRWVQSVENVEIEGCGDGCWVKDGGTYLITGGLGGIGLAVALHMAQFAKVKLILTRYSEFPSRERWQEWIDTHDSEDKTSGIISQLLQIEELGCRVMAAGVDTSSLEHMSELIQSAKARFGPINGVIHAAGISRNGLIQEKDIRLAAQVLAPKVSGILVIDELIGRDEPDFIVLFSSSSSILGEAGFIDYCSANSFLDAYAHYRNTISSTFTVSVNWDEWGQVGMAVNTGARSTRRKITVAEGMELLDRIISARSFEQVAVVPGDFLGRLEEINSFRLSSGQEHKQSANRAAAQDNRPKLGTEYIPPESETEKAIADIWQEQLGVYPVGINDDFFELGGHSLLATSMISILRKKFHKNINLQSFFERSTVAQLAEILGDYGEDMEGEYEEGEL